MKTLPLLAALCLVACDPPKGENDTGTAAAPPHVRVVQEWFANSNYAGAALAATEFDSLHGIEIEVIQGSEQIDALQLVLQGEYEFGDVSADKVLLANARGADLVILATVSPISPTCFLALEGSGIYSANDFRGKRIGVLTGTNTEYVYRALMAKLGISPKDVKEVEADWSMATFITRQYDVQPAFVYDEPVSLELKNIPYTIIQPRDHGIVFPGTVIFAKRSYVDSNRVVVQRFIDSMTDGWRAAVKHPKTAVGAIQELFPDSSVVEREMASLLKSLPYIVSPDSTVLRTSEAQFEQAADILKSLGLSDSIPVHGSVDTTFISDYYKRLRNEK